MARRKRSQRARCPKSSIPSVTGYHDYYQPAAHHAGLQTARQPQRPFLPSDLSSPDQALVRAITARFITYCRGLPDDAAFDIIGKAWPGDRSTERLIERSVTPVTTTATVSALAVASVAAFVASASPNAGSRLFAAGMQVEMGRAASLTLPGVSTYPSVGLIDEGDPIPAAQPVLAAGELTMGKLPVIVGASRMLAEATGAQSLEAIFSALLKEALGRALDAVLFDDSAPGLLEGVSDNGAVAGGEQAALIGDLAGLVGGIVDNGGTGNVYLFAHPGTAVALKVLAGTAFDLPVLSTIAIPAKSVVAIDVGNFATGYGPEPDISISREAMIEFNDPAVGWSTSTPTPVSSLFQQDCIAVRAILRLGFAMRGGTGLVQLVQSVSWVP